MIAKDFIRLLEPKNSKMARPLGFEPRTLCLEGRCSIQLSYGRRRSKYGHYHSWRRWQKRRLYAASFLTLSPDLPAPNQHATQPDECRASLAVLGQKRLSKRHPAGSVRSDIRMAQSSG